MSNPWVHFTVSHVWLNSSSLSRNLSQTGSGASLLFMSFDKIGDASGPKMKGELKGVEFRPPLLRLAAAGKNLDSDTPTEPISFYLTPNTPRVSIQSPHLEREGTLFPTLESVGTKTKGAPAAKCYLKRIALLPEERDTYVHTHSLPLSVATPTRFVGRPTLKKAARRRRPLSFKHSQSSPRGTRTRLGLPVAVENIIIVTAG